jgi:hypothetical protein
MSNPFMLIRSRSFVLFARGFATERITWKTISAGTIEFQVGGDDAEGSAIVLERDSLSVFKMIG